MGFTDRRLEKGFPHHVRQKYLHDHRTDATGNNLQLARPVPAACGDRAIAGDHAGACKSRELKFKLRHCRSPRSSPQGKMDLGLGDQPVIAVGDQVALCGAAAALRVKQTAQRDGPWGSTETAPFSTVIYFPNTHAGNLGLPMPGTQIRFVVHGDRYELRVRGPNVMPAYWHQSEATIAAFDEDGFYRIGDAGRLIDPERPELGILFDGRIAENFKLSSGTWVNVGALRLAVVSACEGLVADAVIAGEGRDDLGLLLFLDEAAVNGQDEAHIAARLRKLLGAYNAAQIGSSTRIARFSIQTQPLSADDGEITDKRYINQRTVLARRSNIVEEMYGRPGNI